MSSRSSRSPSPSRSPSARRPGRGLLDAAVAFAAVLSFLGMLAFGVLSLDDPEVHTELCVSPAQRRCLRCPERAVCFRCRDDAKCGPAAELPGNFTCVNQSFRLYKTCARLSGAFLELPPAEITADKIYAWQRAIFDAVAARKAATAADVAAELEGGPAPLTPENVEDIWVYEGDRYTIEGGVLRPYPRHPFRGTTRWSAAICSLAWIASTAVLIANRSPK
jgi:hypothetical protein